MTTVETFEKIETNLEILCDFVLNYHPSYDGVSSHKQIFEKITAPAAQNMCNIVVEHIKKNNTEDPYCRFLSAVKTKDYSEVYTVLNQCWFNVPESTSCWAIEGFSEAVAILGDPPDDFDPSYDEEVKKVLDEMEEFVEGETYVFGG